MFMYVQLNLEHIIHPCSLIIDIKPEYYCVQYVISSYLDYLLMKFTYFIDCVLILAVIENSVA